MPDQALVGEHSHCKFRPRCFPFAQLIRKVSGMGDGGMRRTRYTVLVNTIPIMLRHSLVWSTDGTARISGTA